MKCRIDVANECVLPLPFELADQHLRALSMVLAID